MSTLNEEQAAMMSDFVEAVRRLRDGRLPILDFKVSMASLPWESTMRSNPEAASLLWGIRSILSEWRDAEGALSARDVADALVQEVRECGLGSFLAQRSTIAS